MKLLASDFDNTLLFDGIFKNQDVIQIKSFQNKGNLFGVCTGRCLSGIIRPSEPYQLEYDFYILLSGALIYNKDREIIYEKKISIDLVKEIFDFLDQQDASVVYQDEMYKVYKEKSSDFRGIYLDSFDELNTNTVSAFSFHYKENELDKAAIDTKLINEQFGDIIEAYQNNQHIDLAAKGCSKGHGMKIIQEYFDLNDDEIYAIGDSWNDLPMLDVVKHSYTFTYAPKDVQKHAEMIVNSVAECISNID